MKMTGRASLKRRLAALPDGLKAAASAQLMRNALELSAAQRRLAPKVSGELTESHAVTDLRAGDRLMVQVSAGDERAFYARMIEFGTRERSASPWFYATYRALKKRLRTKQTGAIRRAVKRLLAS